MSDNFDANEISNVENINASVKDAEIAARGSINFLGGLCLPEVFKSNFPPLYVAIFSLILSAFSLERDFSKFAIGLPRGHAKTTFLKILIIYIILFTKKRFILIVCSTSGMAENFIADVVDILDSPNIIAVFGNWRANLEQDRAEKKKGHFRGRPLVIAGVGCEGTVRGILTKHERPDCIICDDQQSKENAESIPVAKKAIRWFQGTLLKTRNPFGCTTLYVGNMYPDIQIGGSQSSLYTCILRNLQLNPQWISIIVGAILSDGNALWEEVQPKSQLLEELQGDIQMGTPEVFFSEVMNDPTCGGAGQFDLSKMPKWVLDTEFQFKVGSWLLIDPSLGKKKSDAQIVGEGELWDDGLPRCIELHIRQTSAPELVKWCLQYAIAKDIPVIFVEAVAYQASLVQWFEHFIRELKITGINVYPISPDGKQKNTRILNSFRSVLEGKVAVGPACLSQWLSQVVMFDPLRTNNTDDMLDVVAYMEEVPMKFRDAIRIKNFLETTWEDAGSLEADCVSPI